MQFQEDVPLQNRQLTNHCVVCVALIIAGLQIDDFGDTLTSKDVMISPYSFLESEADK